VAKFGVPQGSVLGPLLFLIYLNEFPHIVRIQHTPVVLYADDAMVFVSCNRSQEYFSDYVNIALTKIINWLTLLNLKLNLKKTKLIQFRNYATNPIISLNVTVAGITVEEVSSERFLGVMIDTHLNWKAHINQINKKISSNCYSLSVLAETCSENIVISAYYGNVYALLTYGTIFWGNSLDVNKTFVLQKRCLKTIYRLNPRDSLREVFKLKSFLTLTGIFILEVSLFVKTQKNYFTTLTPTKNNVRAQYKYDIRLPKVKTSIYNM
jgi:hypothetical protein